ncbi:MAG: very short patch repair endonuclease [Polaromonas sp.]
MGSADMADVVDAATRSRMMAGIRGKDTKPELIVRKFLHQQGFRYRLHPRHLPGVPDLLLPKYHTVIFVHGCFWHQHPGCRYATMPKNNAEFWQAKLASNVERDLKVISKLKVDGWRVVVIWECEINEQRLTQLVVQLRSPDTLP